MLHDPCIVLKPEMIRFAKTARVDAFCKLEGGRGIVIGEFVHIASGCHLNIGGGSLFLEDHCTLSAGVKIATGSPDWSYLYVSAAEPPEHRHTRYYQNSVGAYALLCMDVSVVPGVRIGEGAVVKPGSLVKEDVAPWDIVEGNPARVVGKRIITSRDIKVRVR